MVAPTRQVREGKRMRSRREVLAYLAAGGVAAAGLTGCSAAGGARRPSDTLTLATVVDPPSFAPADTRDAHYVQYYQPAYDALLRIAPDGSNQPCLATSWTYDKSLTVLSLTLREGVVFHDGGHFDGAAVAANLMATKKGTGTAASAFAALKEVKVLSPYRVDLILSEPDPGIERQLGMPGAMMASPAALGTPGLTSVPVGTGPYVMDTGATTPTVKYTFVRNPRYWDPDSFPFDRIVLIPVADQTARTNAVRSGQVDGAAGDALNVSAITGAGLRVTTSPGPGFQALFLFDRDGKVAHELRDVRVRRAINHALDRKGILKVLADGRGRTTGQIFNPTSAAADLSLDTVYPYDPARARALLTEAGHPRGFTLRLPQPLSYPNLAPLLGQLLGDVGITVDYVQLPVQTINDQYLAGKFPAVYYQLQSSDPWQAVNFLGTATSPWNPLHADDPEIRAQIDRVRVAPAAERTAAFHELDRLYVDKAWFAPVFFPDAVYFSSRSVEVTPQSLQIVPSIQNYRPAA
ncbi:ABC transporter substrate-binding protein [Streptomyces liangshanensis]|uniref:ABC transporter substrate-binding protein n=1 Tax=Streptomyces liangshanensis TaxID=2717324 RepID=UPI0036D7D431